MPAFLKTYRRVVRNIAWLSLASAAVKPLWFAFITVLCARILGVSGYGALNTALSLAALAFAFTSFGINQYTVREVASDPSLGSRFFTNFVALRIGAYAVASAGALATAGLLGYEWELLIAVGAACVYQAALGLKEYCHSFFQAFERLRYQAVSVVAEKALVVALGAGLLFATRSPEGTLLGMALGMAAAAGGASWWVARHLAPLRWDELDGAFIVDSVRPLLPFALAGLFGMFFYRVDTVMVEAMRGLDAAGQYGIAFRIVEALNMLPLIVAHAAAYPRMSRLASDGDFDELRPLVRIVAGLLTLAALAIALAIAIAAPILIGWISPDPGLAPAGDVLRLLVWAFPLTSLRTTLYVTLLALHEQRYIAIVLGLGVAVNVGLNVLLIPAFGIDGAAVATLASEAALLTVYAVRYRHRVRALAL